MESDARDLARTLGLVRIVAGAALFLMPRRAAWGWTGERTQDATTTLSMRGMGARDVALGLGLVIALDRGAPVRGWLEAGVLSDSADAVATVMSWRSMSNLRGLFWLSAEIGTALFGSRLAQELD